MWITNEKNSGSDKGSVGTRVVRDGVVRGRLKTEVNKLSMRSGTIFGEIESLL